MKNTSIPKEKKINIENSTLHTADHISKNTKLRMYYFAFTEASFLDLYNVSGL